MPTITEGNLRFEFPDEWQASKFDDWGFYRTQFMRELACTCNWCDGQLRCSTCNRRVSTGPKGIDILAIATTRICWHIEIKDYRRQALAEYEFLADAVAEKVKDTLAALVIARISARDEEEKTQARDALQCDGMRIVLHLEQPRTRSRLHPVSTRQANVQQRLRQLVRTIDRDAVVVSMATIADHKLAWTVHPNREAG